MSEEKPDWPIALVLTWDDDKQLKIDYSEAKSARSRIQSLVFEVMHEYGLATALDLETLFYFAHKDGGLAGEWWWDPSEHLYKLGLWPRCSEPAINSMFDRMNQLHNTTLEAEYDSGMSLIGPLVGMRMTHGPWRSLALHDSLLDILRAM